MPIQFLCSKCSNPLRTPDGSEGRRCKCPKCGDVQVIPGASPSGTSSARNPSASTSPAATSSAPPPTSGSAFENNPYAFQPSANPNVPSAASAKFRPQGYAPHRANTVLALGIVGTISGVVSLVGCLCCVFWLFFPVALGTGIPAWVMGAADLKAMKANQMDPSGMGPTKTGMIFGIVAVGATALVVILTIVRIILNLVMIGAGGGQGGFDGF